MVQGGGERKGAAVPQCWITESAAMIGPDAAGFRRVLAFESHRENVTVHIRRLPDGAAEVAMLHDIENVATGDLVNVQFLQQLQQQPQ